MEQTLVAAAGVSRPRRLGAPIRRYLIVDDSPAVRHRLAALLGSDRSARAVCVEADRKAPALEALGRERFDAAFVGLVLGGGENGLHLIEAISERWPALPTVVHSSRAESDPEVREAMSQGAAAYLAKPLRTLELQRVLRELERGHIGAGSIP